MFHIRNGKTKLSKTKRHKCYFTFNIFDILILITIGIILFLLLLLFLFIIDYTFASDDTVKTYEVIVIDKHEETESQPIIIGHSVIFSYHTCYYLTLDDVTRDVKCDENKYKETKVGDLVVYEVKTTKSKIFGKKRNKITVR